MKTTIEERAKAFCEKNICVDCADRKDCDRGCMGCCIPTFSALEWLIQFGKSEHAESTRWNDPKNHPEPNRTVLTKWKYKDGGNEIISVGEYNGEEWNAQAIVYPEIFDMIGWREIHK